MNRILVGLWSETLSGIDGKPPIAPAHVQLSNCINQVSSEYGRWWATPSAFTSMTKTSQKMSDFVRQVEANFGGSDKIDPRVVVWYEKERGLPQGERDLWLFSSKNVTPGKTSFFVLHTDKLGDRLRPADSKAIARYMPATEAESRSVPTIAGLLEPLQEALNQGKWSIGNSIGSRAVENPDVTMALARESAKRGRPPSSIKVEGDLKTDNYWFQLTIDTRDGKDFIVMRPDTMMGALTRLLTLDGQTLWWQRKPSEAS